MCNDISFSVRTSAGIRACDYAGNFYSKVSTDIDLGCINTGNSLAVEIKYDDKLPEDEFAVIQVGFRINIDMASLTAMFPFSGCYFVYIS